MKLVLPTALLALVSCTSAPVAQNAPPGSTQAGRPSAAIPERQMSLAFGQRDFNDQDFWTPNEDQGMFGIEFAEEGPENGIGWEIGLAGSYDESSFAGTDWTGRTWEMYAGVRKSFGRENVRPYLGAGLSFIDARWESGGFDDNDSSPAGYVHGGIDFLASPTFFIGLDLRLLFASDLALGPLNGDADYTQAALRLGWRF